MTEIKKIEKPKKDWEIVAFLSHFLGNDNVILSKQENGSFLPGFCRVEEEFLLKQPDAKVYSVKRIDGEIFSLDDEIEYGSLSITGEMRYHTGKIRCFEIREGEITAKGESFSFPLSSTTKSNMAKTISKEKIIESLVNLDETELIFNEMKVNKGDMLSFRYNSNLESVDKKFFIKEVSINEFIGVELGTSNTVSFKFFKDVAKSLNS